IHAVDPEAQTTAVNGAEGPTATSNGGPVVVVYVNVNWGTSAYGGAFFRVAMNEIGHALGLATNYSDPGSIMGTDGNVDPTVTPPDQVGTGPDAPPSTTESFPAAPDVNSLQFLYRTDSKDVNLYKFSVTQSGTLNAETLAQRLTPTSQLNTVLSLYNELTLLGVPTAGGQAVSPTNAAIGLEGQTFNITSTTPSGAQLTRTFEFNSGFSLTLPNTPPADGTTFKLAEGATTITFEFALDGRVVSDGNSPIAFNTGDPVSTVATAIINAINFAVKNQGLSGGHPPILATYSGLGVINIGGDAATVFTDVNSGLTMSGSQTLTTPGAVMVRYAPAGSQHDLSVAIASAINSPVLDVLNTPDANHQNGKEQFTLNNGLRSLTFELDASGVASAPGIIPIQFNPGDAAAVIAGKLAAAVNNANPLLGFGEGSASVVGNHVTLNFTTGSVTASTSAVDLGVLNVSATVELTQVQLQGSLTLDLTHVAEFT